MARPSISQLMRGLAREAGVPSVARTRNGEMLRLLPGDEPKAIGHVPFGILVKDGSLVRDPEGSGVVERRKMSFAGVVVCTLLMNGRGDILGEYGLNCFGLPETDNKGEDFEDVLAAAVDGCLVSIPKVRRKDEDLVAEAVRRSIRAAANERWGKKADHRGDGAEGGLIPLPPGFVLPGGT